MRPIKTVVIEDDELLREGLRKTLAGKRFQPLRVCCTLDELSEFPACSRDHLVILGTRDADAASQHIARLRRRTATARIVVLFERHDLQSAFTDLLLAGANALLLKSVSCAVLLKSLDLVLLDGSVIVCSTDLLKQTSLSDSFQLRASTISSKRTAPSDVDVVGAFSGRELAILSCLECGESNKAIGRKLGITESTVKMYLKAIMLKLRVQNRTQAAVWAKHQPLGSLERKVRAAAPPKANGYGRSGSVSQSLGRGRNAA